MSQQNPLPQITSASTESAQTTQLQEGSQATVGSQILGMQFNPTRRRFHFCIATTTLELSKTVEVNVQVSITAATTQLAAFVRFVPFAFLESLEMVALPSVGARNAQTTILSAWIPGCDAFPDDWEKIREYPSAMTSLVGPALRNGFVAPISFPATFDWGVQRQLKPVPYIGGVPRFAARLEVCPMPEVTGKLQVFQWLVTTVVCIDRSASQLAGGLA